MRDASADLVEMLEGDDFADDIAAEAAAEFRRAIRPEPIHPLAVVDGARARCLLHTVVAWRRGLRGTRQRTTGRTSVIPLRGRSISLPDRGCGGDRRARERRPDPRRRPARAGRRRRRSSWPADWCAKPSSPSSECNRASADGHPAARADGCACSDRSLERDDPLAGTGGFGERWFLVEIDGSWGRHAFLNSRLDPQLGTALVRPDRGRGDASRSRSVAPTGERTRAARRPSWRWAIVDTRPGIESTRWGSVDDPALLLEVPLDGSSGLESTSRHLRMHPRPARPVLRGEGPAGRHGTRCDVIPNETWECSHLGGDRFAATMMIFPAGLYYGRVSEADAPGLVEQYRKGRVDPRYFRGRSSSPNVVQAAEAVARAEFPDDAIDAFTHRSTASEQGGWKVAFDHGSDRVVVHLAASTSAPLLTTCEATVALPVRQFELISVAVD